MLKKTNLCQSGPKVIWLQKFFLHELNKSRSNAQTLYKLYLQPTGDILRDLWVRISDTWWPQRLQMFLSLSQYTFLLPKNALLFPELPFHLPEVTFSFLDLPFCFPEVLFYFSKLPYCFPELPFSFPEVSSFCFPESVFF